MSSYKYIKKKIIVVDKISFNNLIYVFLFRLLFSKIFYVEISNSLKKKFIISLLSKADIYWINYQDYEIIDAHSNKILKNIQFCDNISKFISDNIWSKSLKFYFLKKAYLESCLISKIRNDCETIFETFEIARILAKNNFSVTIIVTKNFFFKSIKEKYYNKDNFFCISNINLSILIKLFYLIIFFLRKISFIIFFKLVMKPLKQDKKNLTIHDYKTIYFPHKGMFYLNNLKDIFYSKTNFFFKKQNIIHAEWSFKEVDRNTIDFYKKNNIYYIFWDSLKSTKYIFLLFINFTTNNFTNFIKYFRYNIFFHIFSSIYHINSAEEKLSTFKNLKIALIGYDILFPVELSLALKKKNIITISVQDRIATVSLSNKMILDHYFVLGHQTLKILKKRMSNTITNFYKSYPLKIDKIKVVKSKPFKKKLNCLVIDFHSVGAENWYINGRSINNWKHNDKFYKFIIKLSQKYKNINFLIKSKDYNWTANKYFGETLSTIYNSKNIKIMKDFTPEDSLLVADFGLARHSSLSDELLYLGKPVIIYDLGGYPSSFFDFSNRIICHNDIAVVKKIDFLLKNFKRFNKIQDTDRKKIFYHNSIVKLDQFLNKLTNSL
jgi:hypothetical protein